MLFVAGAQSRPRSRGRWRSKALNANEMAAGCVFTTTSLRRAATRRGARRARHGRGLTHAGFLGRHWIGQLVGGLRQARLGRSVNDLSKARETRAVPVCSPHMQFDGAGQHRSTAFTQKNNSPRRTQGSPTIFRRRSSAQCRRGAGTPRRIGAPRRSRRGTRQSCAGRCA